jgi:hypothetical protein
VAFGNWPDPARGGNPFSKAAPYAPSNGAGPDDLDYPVVIVPRVNLRTQLKDTVMAIKRLQHLLPLPNTIGQGLLAIHILARLKRHNGNLGVPVVGRGTGNGVNIRPVQQMSKIGIGFGLRVGVYFL